MRLAKSLLRRMMSVWRYDSALTAPHNADLGSPSWDFLDEFADRTSTGIPAGSHSGTTSARGTDSPSNSQLTNDIARLRSDIEAIRNQSLVTIGHLTALRADFVALANSGLYPDPHDLATFENDLLTTVATSITAGNNRRLTTADMVPGFSGSITHN